MVKTMSVARIFFVSNSAKGEYTGRLKWACILKEHGYNIKFVLPVEEENYIKKIELKGIIVHRWCLKRGKKHILNKLIAIISLYRIFKQNEIDIIHSFGHEANICSAIAARLCGYNNVINHITGLGSEFTEKTTIIGKLILFLYRLTKLMVKHFVFENENDYSLFSFIPTNMKSIIPASGIDTVDFSPDNIDWEHVRELREELGIKDGDIVITFIGRLLRHKGIYELLESWKEIYNKADNVHLLLVGEIDRDNSTSINESEIDFILKLKNLRLLNRRNDIKELLFITDIFVNPSYREGLPRTNIEAMAMAKPIVTTDTAGCKDTVNDGVSGFLVPVGDSKALTMAVTKLINNDQLRVEMGEKAREKAIAEFSVEKIINRIEEKYTTLLSGNGEAQDKQRQ
jgi:N,N'-diacetylbacillosaminyl-diphospho-undecaprenol alpha-1,3-N-acetylgalactosaminyltransferase